MTDQEYELMDELYFVQHFDALRQALKWEEAQLQEQLIALHKRGWLKCLKTPDEELFDESAYADLRNWYFLATKQGLKALHAL
ncbi:MAG: hypothetical protein ACXIT9_14350 [Nitritalea sp.]